MPTDPRLAAFLSGRHEVFTTIQHRQQIWRPDPFDVEDINAPARRAFERLLDRATATPPPDSGKILLLLGESGSGKTHLLRAFRNMAHGNVQGFVGYMPMTVDTSNYDRYILSNLIDSLDQAYDTNMRPDSGLMRLSSALLSRSTSAQAQRVANDEEPLEGEALHQAVIDAADALLADERYRNSDLDLLRALLYLQRKDPRIHHRVLKWLRCEDLSGPDRKMLGDLVPRTADDDPRRMVEHLGRIMASIHHALVLCVDQVEDVYNFENNPRVEPSFRRAMGALSAIISSVPSAVVVLCFLSDFWVKMKPQLTRALLDRLENDPEPIALESLATAETARQITTLRLQNLYDQMEVRFDPNDPTFPFPFPGFEKLSGQRTRDVLDACRRYREKAAQDQRLPDTFPLESSGRPITQPPVAPPKIEPKEDLEQMWTDFRAGHKQEPPEDDPSLATLLAWAIQESSHELSNGPRFSVEKKPSGVEISILPGNTRLFVALCNKGAQGGHLGRQIAQVRESAAGRVPVVVRTTAFPQAAKGVVAQEIGLLVQKGGRRAVLGDSDLRALLALRTFHESRSSSSSFQEWRRTTKPITRLKVIRDILDLERLVTEASAAAIAAPVSAPAAPPPAAPPSRPVQVQAAAAKPSQPEVALSLGVTEGLLAEPVLLQPDELTKHSAFLGGSGSGKTTLALNAIEQLLLQGTPVIVVDRKGDLAAYARPEAWEEQLSNPALAERRRLLRERVEVALYTPGRADGRALAIPIVPRGLGTLPSEEREQGVQHAADAIAGMLEYRQTPRDKAARVLLTQALHLLVQQPRTRELTLEMVQQFVASQDPLLLNEAGRLDPKVFTRLAQDLETLRLGMRSLLTAGGEQLELGELLGLQAGSASPKTRLSIISTKFLGDNTRVLFWVAQLLIETSRWANQHPSNRLQAVLLFDEADVYLPAMSQPATKQPMENLLRRARSAGVGIMLATQSPGDLDYRCRDNVRTWFVGRVKENTALAKLKPMFSDVRVDISSKLPAQKQGQFHVLRDGQVQRLEATRSVIRTEQLSEEQILQLAKQTQGRSVQGVPAARSGS
ncbi:ATP-binding protein [Hyalangium versicolor]|uniref:ATP-binding protein n=1 Tax=Hyalangium versicolor TaxID=2861190 RepID=UPI001CCD8571|nr:DUF87 domain-containing protein [Hyalangium versicolor]